MVAVIDDDPLVCELLSAMLEREFAVASFTDPRAALISVLEGAFDLVLCDVMMPNLSGPELYHELGRRRSELQARVLFITGGVFTQEARHFVETVQRPVLRKPCAQEALLEACWNTLAEHGHRMAQA